MKTRHGWPAAAGAVAVLALLGGCGLGFGDEMIGSSSATAGSTGIAVPTPPSGPDQGQAVGATGAGSAPADAGGAAPSSGNQTAAVTQLRAGIWDVGDGGKVEFIVNHGQLELMSSNPAAGWQQETPIEQPDNVEVTFTQSLGTTWTFDVRLSGGTMRITKTQSVSQAADGSYPVGGAGSVAFTNTNNRLTLGSVVPEAGWSVSTKQATPTSITVSFKKGAGTADFGATLSGQAVTVTTDQQLSGPAPTK